jgi:hypothetical protein
VVQKNLGVHDNDIKKVKRKGGKRELKRKENIFLHPPSLLILLTLLLDTIE